MKWHMAGRTLYLVENTSAGYLVCQSVLVKKGQGYVHDRSLLQIYSSSLQSMSRENSQVLHISSPTHSFVTLIADIMLADPPASGRLGSPEARQRAWLDLLGPGYHQGVEAQRSGN